MKHLPVLRCMVARFALLAPVLLVLAPTWARAVDATVTFTVNTTMDQIDDNTSDGICHTSANTCSLRAAIMQANRVSTNGSVHIKVPAGRFTLSLAPTFDNGEASGDLNLTTPVSPSPYLYIDGDSSATTVIDANHTDRALSVSAGRIVFLSKLTVLNGNDSDRLGAGGGIQNQGLLRLDDCIIENNYSASAGGGIASLLGSMLTLQHVTIRSNATAYSGGGLYLAGPATLGYASISANLAQGAGGGVFVSGYGNAHFYSSTISSNGANFGGGIEVYFTLVHPQEIPEVTLVNSTLSGNFAYTDGGGVNNLSKVYSYNSSIIDNDADHDRDELGGVGGGVNTASGMRFIAVNSLIARNTILDAPIYNDCNGTLEVYGRNLFNDVAGCSFTGNGIPARGFVDIDSIGPLQDNGGLTLTHALLAGSSAINATTTQGCVDDTLVSLSLDERGGLRGEGLNCDVGAYEYGATPPVTDRIFRNGFEVVP